MNCTEELHEHAEVVCESCRTSMCWSCADSNWHLPHDPEDAWMECPCCGHVMRG